MRKRWRWAARGYTLASGALSSHIIGSGIRFRRADRRCRLVRVRLDGFLHSARIAVAALFISASAVSAQTGETTAGQYEQCVRPLLSQFCLKCHSTEKHKSDLDLERFTSSSEVLKDIKVWERVVEQLTFGQMPPEEELQPPEEQIRQLID